MSPVGSSGFVQPVIWPAICPGPAPWQTNLTAPETLIGTPKGRFGYDFVNGGAFGCDLQSRNLSWLIPVRYATTAADAAAATSTAAAVAAATPATPADPATSAAGVSCCCTCRTGGSSRRAARGRHFTDPPPTFPFPSVRLHVGFAGRRVGVCSTAICTTLSKHRTRLRLGRQPIHRPRHDRPVDPDCHLHVLGACTRM